MNPADLPQAAERAPRRAPALVRQDATAIVRRHIDPDLTVTSIRMLYGGSINHVFEWTTDGLPSAVVAKMNLSHNVRHFHREKASLEFFRRFTRLPVPDPWVVMEDEPELDGAGLLMQRLDGCNLSDARLTPRGLLHLQHELAKHVIDLHTHHRATYGSALTPEGQSRWLDNFQPILEEEFAAVRDLLSSNARWFIDDLIAHLERWLPEQATPTLVHGDLWATNILVDDAHPDAPVITGFVDAAAQYCDPEYELAYLRMFHTAGEAFFELYRRRHPLRPGFSRRCRIYWLNTALMHVRTFGERYLPQCEELVQQLRVLERQ